MQINIIIPKTNISAIRKQISILLLLLLFNEVNAFSQERFGISNSMYSGITSASLNPAYLAGSPYKWDLNILTAHLYLDNNYLYLYPTNIPDLIADQGSTSIKNNGTLNQPLIVSLPLISIKIDNIFNSYSNINSKYIIKDKRYNSWRKNFYVKTLVQTPSLMINVKKWSFALITATRAEASFTRFHKIGANLLFEGVNYDPINNIDVSIPKFRINAMIWDEIGVSVARKIKQENGYLIEGGITIKHVRGFGAAYILNKEIKLSIPNAKDIYIENIDTKFGYAFDAGNTLRTIGSGKSIDVGIAIEKKILKNKYQCPNFCNKKFELQYSWKLGFSLIDIGYIRFNNSAKIYHINGRSDMWYNIVGIKGHGIGWYDSIMGAHFNNGQLLAPIGTKFTMFLPWAASVQFDYNIGYNFYVNGTLIQRIPHFGLPGIDRVNTISITPSYELRKLGFAVPVVFYQYLWPRIGLALRLNNFLIIGTDKLGAFTGKRLSGEDIYVILKINNLKKCKTSKKKRKTAPSF